MNACKLCSQDLTIELDPEDFNEATSAAAGGLSTTVPDDLELCCGCHFHWQCLLDESPRIAISPFCPSCTNSIASPASGPLSSSLQILTRYHNEGGVQENLDILPLIAEEAYLDANPAARPARAYMTLCGEGDVVGIIELLQAIIEDPDEGDMSPAQLLRYQDPLDGMKTGLHIAIENSRPQSVWLLLWLTSSLPTPAFPRDFLEEVSQAAEVVVARGEATGGGPDIRSLRDGEGRTAEDAAGSMGNTWAGLLGAGVLKELN